MLVVIVWVYIICLCPGWTLGAVLYENSHIQHDCEHTAAAAGDGDDNDDIRVVLSRLLVVGSDENMA